MRRFALSLALAAIWLPPDGHASERGFSAYDGDTLRATFRIENIDTPEIQGKCAAERRLAEQARDFTRAWLARGNVTIQQTGIDRFGRVLARVTRGDEDLGEALIAAGYARKWDGKRRSWC